MGVCVFVHGHVSDGVSCTMILRTTLLRSTSSVPCCSWLPATSDELDDACKTNGQRDRPTRGGQSRVTEAFPATHESSDTGTLPTMFLASHGPGCCLLPVGALALTKRHTTDVRCPWVRPMSPNPCGVCGGITQRFPSASHKVFPLVPQNRARLPDGTHRLWVCARAHALRVHGGRPELPSWGGSRALAFKGAQTRVGPSLLSSPLP